MLIYVGGEAFGTGTGHDWHWWCDSCDVAEARLTRAVAVGRAAHHDLNEHEGLKRAQHKQFVREDQ